MKKFIQSLVYALAGIKYCLKNERNFKIQLFAALLAIAAATFFKCTSTEWMIILICIAAVLSLEMLNSAIEKLCNMQQTTFNPAIKIIKDVAAGAVLVMSLIAVICGAIILLPKLLQLF